MTHLGPMAISFLCGIFGAAFLSLGGIFLLIVPAVYYFAGIRAGIIGVLISVVPTCFLFYGATQSQEFLLSFFLFILMPILLWISVYRFRTLDHLLSQSKQDFPLTNFGLPKMFSVFIFGLCLVYAFAFSIPQVQAYFYGAYQGAMPVFDQLAKTCGLKTEQILQQLPDCIVFMLLSIHLFSFLVAFSTGRRFKLWSWDNHPEDYSYALWWDVPFVIFLSAGITASLLQVPEFVQIIFSCLTVLSAMPLLMLGVQVFKIVGRSYGYKKRTINIVLGVLFFLGHPLVFVLLLGLMESVVGISKRFQYNSR
ncbi:MAG TPA: hypothetical protein DIC42_02260 [Holosporales bacterium]|nr:hypothetical protein [Holosporales bacterium]